MHIPNETDANEPLDQLLSLISPEALGDDVFEGRCRNRPRQRVYGGLVLAQALVAAGRTVAVGRTAHSLHAYFMRPGDDAEPITYQVERARDGGSFSTRRVVASQHGRPIFNLSASFQIQEQGESHQHPMPDVPPPESLEDQYDVLMRHLDEIPEAFHRRISPKYPLRFRLTQPEHPVQPGVRDDHCSLWMKAEGRMPDDVLLHQGLLAYASDYRLLGASLRPHGRSMFAGQTMMASLDHALWLHRPLRMDDWLLYVFDSPSASNARGFSRGSIYSRDGVLVASVAQEGLIRPLDDR